MLYTTKSDYTPEVFWLASMQSGQTFIEDSTPGEISAWRRLREYIYATGDFCTKLRVQTPHKQIEFSSPNLYLYHMNGICNALNQPEALHYNHSYRVFAAAISANILETYVVFSTESWRHVGNRLSYFKQTLPQDYTVEQLNESIDMDSVGIIRNF